ncbi:MAG: hypothetical protein JXR37_12680 [Kiritimatiellae bacterium]|nr:hypothetical protein [Kiritimatiellia bacterium]
MRSLLDDPEFPASEPSKKRARPAPPSADGLGLMEKKLQALTELREFYGDLTVAAWGRLPESVKTFLQSCSMGEYEKAKRIAAEIAKQLDEGLLRPDDVPFPVRKTISRIL